MNRRDVCRIALALPLAPGLLASAAEAAVGHDGRVRRLLLVELNGGNDGLNTIVPAADPRYHALRPRLGLAASEVLPLGGGLGLHPALAPLLPCWSAGELAIVQGVGYAHSNRSHFRSIEIWDTATDAEVVGRRGWLARVDPQEMLGRRFAAPGVVIGRNPAPLAGGAQAPLVFGDSERFVEQARGVPAETVRRANPALRHILAVQSGIRVAARGLGAGRPRPAGDFPPGAFGRDAAEAAALLADEPLTPVVKIALTGFDTHVNQRARHDALLAQLAQGLAALRTAFIEAGIWQDVLVMTYSEFGRRAGENGSAGTDHGKAAPHLVLGGAVKGGLHGEAPRLGDLDDGDVPVSLDYRRLYNAVLTRWWPRAASQAIEPARFPALAIV